MQSTRSTDWAKFASTDLVTTDFTTTPIIPTTTEPTASSTKAVIQWRGTGAGANECPNAILIMPYGTGSDNDTLDMRLYGWKRVSGSATTLWRPTLILQISCTLSTDVGIASAEVLNTHRFADTITATVAPTTAEIISPATLGVANQAAWVLVDGLGFDKLELTVDRILATAGNALYAAL